MNRSRFTWQELATAAGALPKDRALHVGTTALSWAEIVSQYDFIPLTRDGQWMSVALVKKGQDPVFLDLPDGQLLHAPVIQVNVRGDNAAFYVVVPDVWARGHHQYNFGAPFFLPEPELGVPVPADAEYRNDQGLPVDAQGLMITGVIVKDGPGPQGNVIKRTNLTNLAQGMQSDGSIIIDEVTYYLYGLFAKDRNRFAPARMDAYFSPTRPGYVTVRELEGAM